MMNILIIGCGTMGSALAAALDKKGYDICVIDKKSESFEALPADFGGFTATGVAIDQDVLKRAGISACDALFAVTENDDMNLMTAQISREIFGVPRIFARVDDVGKCRVFEGLGVKIISPTRLTVSAACEALEGDNRDRELKFGNALVKFTTIEVPENYEGKTLRDILLEEDESFFGIEREGTGFTLYFGQEIVFEAGDKLIFAKKN